MDNRLRVSLLSSILSSNGVYQHKYTDAYNKIKAIIELEKEENDTERLNNKIFNKFEEIELMTYNLSPELKGIPLMVVEQYFLRNTGDLNNYLCIMYRDIDIFDLKAIDVYVLLEKFFSIIYILASKIADVYALEIKLKNNKNDDSKMDLI